MATFKSTQVTNAEAKPIVRLAPRDWHGRARDAFFNYTQAANGAVNDVVELVQLPPGKVRLLVDQAVLTMSDKGAGALLDIGWAAFVDEDGNAVVADDNDLADNVDIATGTTTIRPNLNLFKTFDSRDGVTLTATFRVVAPVAADTLQGYFLYVVD